jgi:thioredoxin 2
MNRVPLDKLRQGLEPLCGRCKTPLPVNTVITVTDATFPEEVERSALPVLVDMWAEWCGPCKMIAPAVDQLAKEMAGRLRVAKLDIDKNPVTASRFRIQSIPALLVVKDGREVDRIIGAQPKSEIARRLRQWVA